MVTLTTDPIQPFPRFHLKKSDFSLRYFCSKKRIILLRNAYLATERISSLSLVSFASPIKF